MSKQDAIAAEWWDKHSNAKQGADYARRIREGDDAGLGHGQFAAIIRKGVARGTAAGLTGEVEQPKGKAKSDGGAKKPRS